MQAFGDQFLARPALADDEHGPPHGRGATGALDRIEEGPGLPDKLIFPLHDQEIGIFPNAWQQKPTCHSSKIEKTAEIRRFPSLAHPLLNMGQQQLGHLATGR